MIVIDSSVFVDFLFDRNDKRHKIAFSFFQSIRNHIVYIPKVAIVEIIAITHRLGIISEKNMIINLFNDFNMVKEEEIFDSAMELAGAYHPRAIDSYFMATALLTGSILVSNDRRMVNNSQGVVEAFYLLDDHELIQEKLESTLK